jgi:hypothetical protein
LTTSPLDSESEPVLRRPGVLRRHVRPVTSPGRVLVNDRDSDRDSDGPGPGPRPPGRSCRRPGPASTGTQAGWPPWPNDSNCESLRGCPRPVCRARQCPGPGRPPPGPAGSGNGAGPGPLGIRLGVQVTSRVSTWAGGPGAVTSPGLRVTGSPPPGLAGDRDFPRSSHGVDNRGRDRDGPSRRPGR